VGVEIMGRHAAHWQPLIDSGQMVVFGPVLDGTGPWGLGVVETEDEDELRSPALINRLQSAVSRTNKEITNAQIHSQLPLGQGLRRLSRPQRTAAASVRNSPFCSAAQNG
jgi:hypothetical protein